jgi:hypothetical protein
VTPPLLFLKDFPLGNILSSASLLILLILFICKKYFCSLDGNARPELFFSSRHSGWILHSTISVNYFGNRKTYEYIIAYIHITVNKILVRTNKNYIVKNVIK